MLRSNLNRLFALLIFALLSSTLFAQQNGADPHDFGRMWTFENPPVEWFQEAYDFEPGPEWFDHVRKSSLRFASWCSGSFVSPDGLIMTNHHCSRGVSLQVQEEGEDFTE
jgi:S1-C subfamily serine protease